MIAQQAYAKYRERAVQTASPERLLIMLYDGLLQSMNMAKQAIGENRNPDAHQQLVKAQDIVLELTSSLNMDYEISHALAALYDYFYRKLVDANVQKSIAPVDEIFPRIVELREAWIQAATQLLATAEDETSISG